MCLQQCVIALYSYFLYNYLMCKQILTIALVCACVAGMTGCSSVRKVAANSMSDMLAGIDKKGRKVEKKAGSPNIMSAVTGESDAILISDFFPTALKMYEIVQASNPEHLGLQITCGSLNVMYANVFVQLPADQLTDEQYDLKYAEYKRAKAHYLKGRDFILGALGKKYAGFADVILSDDNAAVDKAVLLLKQEDVDAAYWCAAGALGAFALDPLDPELLGRLYGPVAMLERAAALNPDYNLGAIWSVLAAFYFSAPADFGGDTERGMYCYNEALRVADGKSPSPYIMYAESVCTKNNDETGFIDCLQKALAINPDDVPDNRLATIIFQNKARWLLGQTENYFIHW